MENNLKTENKELVLFENNKIRRQMYNGEWYYSIVDIISILTESSKPRDYWYRLKKRMSEEEEVELSTNCRQLKMLSNDGKKYFTDCANRETIFRIIQSVPSPNAEPFKIWFARLAEERIQEVINPELAIIRAKETYLKKGYSEIWINTRIKGIQAREELTTEWKNRGVTTSKEFAILTDEISVSTFDITTKEHKNIKNLTKNQNLRDNMSPLELALTTLAEVTTTEFHKTNNSKGLAKLKKDAHEGGEIAKEARQNIEKKLGKPVVTKENALDFTNNRKIETKK